MFHFSRIHFLFGVLKRWFIFFFFVFEINVVFMAAKKYRVDYFFLSFHLELEFIGRVWYYPCYEASDREHYELEHKHKSQAGGEKVPVVLGVAVWIGAFKVTRIPI